MITDVQRVLQILRREREKGCHSFDLCKEVGTYRVAARINDLKNKGYQINSRSEKRGNAWGVRYILYEKPKPRIKVEFNGNMATWTA